MLRVLCVSVLVSLVSFGLYGAEADIKHTEYFFKVSRDKLVDAYHGKLLGSNTFVSVMQVDGVFKGHVALHPRPKAMAEWTWIQLSPDEAKKYYDMMKKFNEEEAVRREQAFEAAFSSKK